MPPPISKKEESSSNTVVAAVTTKTSSDYVIVDETRFKTNAFLVFSIACMLVINPLMYLLIRHGILSQAYYQYMIYILIGAVVSGIIDSLIVNVDIKTKLKDSCLSVAVWVAYLCMAFKRRNKPWWYGLLLTISLVIVDYVVAFVIVFLASTGGASSFDSVPSNVSVFDWMDSKFSDESDYVEPEEFIDE